MRSIVLYYILLSLTVVLKVCGNTSEDVCNPPKRVYNLTGDVIIAGLMPVHVRASHDLNKAGVMWVEAMIFAIHEINQNRTLLPNIKLGYDIRDSCNMVDLALEAALDFILSPNNNKIESLSAKQNERVTSCVCKRNKTGSPQVVAVVGGATSSISTSVSPVFSADSITQISYSSTSPSLSDKVRYSSFFRTIPSDIYQAKAIADMLAYFNWTYVSVIVTDNEYGRNGLAALRTNLKLQGICIAVEELFRKSPESDMKRDISTIVAKLVEDKRSSVVVLWCDHPQARAFLQQATGKLTNVTWIGTESWGDNSDVKNEVEFSTIGGMLGVLPYFGRYKKFEDYLQTVTVNSAVENPWLSEFWAEERAKCGNCSDNQLPTAANLPPNKYANVMDAVYAIAYGLQTLQESSPQNLTLDTNILPELFKSIKHVQFNGHSGKGGFKFSDTGDPDYGAYIIKNLQGNENTKDFLAVAHYDGERGRLEFEPGVQIQWAHGQSTVPLSRCSEICGRGYAFVKSSRDCCWSCVRCREDFVKDSVGNIGCSKCPEGYTSNSERTQCVEVELDVLRWHSAGAIVAMVFSFLGLVLVCFVLAVFWKYSATAVVKASNRELSAVHLICHGLVFPIPFTYIGIPNIGTCILRSYLFSIFFTLITSITFLKTDRIVRIFNSKSRLTKRSRLLSNKVQLILTLAMTSVPTIGTTVWVVLRPLTVSTKRVDSELVVYCGESANELHLIQLAYILFIALLCTYEAYNARKLPESFNEAKFICFATFGFVLMWIGYIPACLDTVGSSKQFVTCLFVLLTNYVSLAVIYAPKLNIILLHPETNRHETFRRSTLRTCITMASRIPTPLTDTPVLSRERSTSLPNALQTTIVSSPRYRIHSLLADVPNGSHRNLVPTSGKYILDSRSNTPSPSLKSSAPSTPAYTIKSISYKPNNETC